MLGLILPLKATKRTMNSGTPPLEFSFLHLYTSTWSLVFYLPEHNRDKSDKYRCFKWFWMWVARLDKEDILLDSIVTDRHLGKRPGILHSYYIKHIDSLAHAGSVSWKGSQGHPSKLDNPLEDSQDSEKHIMLTVCITTVRNKIKISQGKSHKG